MIEKEFSLYDKLEFFIRFKIQSTAFTEMHYRLFLFNYFQISIQNRLVTWYIQYLL